MTTSILAFVLHITCVEFCTGAAVYGRNDAGYLVNAHDKSAACCVCADEWATAVWMYIDKTGEDDQCVPMNSRVECIEAKLEAFEQIRLSLWCSASARLNKHRFNCAHVDKALKKENEACK